VDAVLVPGGDPCALAGALRRVLYDGDLPDRLTAAGVGRAEEFSMDRMARRYLELYVEMLGR
jgi:glycosyltransferase involved in cell wall biosynthesis